MVINIIIIIIRTARAVFTPTVCVAARYIDTNQSFLGCETSLWVPVSPCLRLERERWFVWQFQFQFVYSQPIRIEAEKGRTLN